MVPMHYTPPSSLRNRKSYFSVLQAYPPTLPTTNKVTAPYSHKQPERPHRPLCGQQNKYSFNASYRTLIFTYAISSSLLSSLENKLPVVEPGAKQQRRPIVAVLVAAQASHEVKEGDNDQEDWEEHAA